MPEFLTKVDWVNSVVVAIILYILFRIVETVIQPKITNWWNNQFEKGRLRNQIYAKRFDAEVKRLLDNPQEEIILRQRFALSIMGIIAIFIVFSISLAIASFQLTLKKFDIDTRYSVLLIIVLPTLALVFSSSLVKSFNLISLLAELDKRKGRPTNTSDFYKPNEESENKKAPNE